MHDVNMHPQYQSIFNAGYYAACMVHQPGAAPVAMLDHLGNYFPVPSDMASEQKMASYPPHSASQCLVSRFGSHKDLPVHPSTYGSPSLDVYPPNQMHVPHAFHHPSGGLPATRGRRGAVRERSGAGRREPLAPSLDTLSLDRTLSDLIGKVCSQSHSLTSWMPTVQS
jgi:hypothetical protein